MPFFNSVLRGEQILWRSKGERNKEEGEKRTAEESPHFLFSSLLSSS
jgi:hypothetical protein